uniref:Uncharacterized protein n=1 Tax=Sipha flava TaxID=143950 RepID=A0A2S2PX45_9HEMI
MCISFENVYSIYGKYIQCYVTSLYFISIGQLTFNSYKQIAVSPDLPKTNLSLLCVRRTGYVTSEIDTAGHSTILNRARDHRMRNILFVDLSRATAEVVVLLLNFSPRPS